MSLKFNLYGFIIGVALVTGVTLIENKIKNEKLLSKHFYKISFISLIFAVVGARSWHVATDFYLYSNNLLGIFKIWNGGLSILGGVIGGIMGLALSFYFIEDLKKLSIKRKKNEILKLLDYSIFGLPVGQAIGRLGNYFNQELYGVPTNGFFKVFIDRQHRLPGFENYEYYHPLFFYEMLATALFAVGLYFVYKKHWFNLPKIGSGKFFLSYILYYSSVRFFLDFLRIDKTFVLNGIIGTNQFVLLFIIIPCGFYFISHIIKKYV